MWMSDKTPFIDRTCTQQGRTLDTMQPSAVEQQGSVDASLMLSPQALKVPAWRADGKKKTSKWVPVFPSFWSTVWAFQNKPNQGNISGKSGWTHSSTAIKRWNQSVYINEHGLVTFIRGDDDFKSVNFGEEAEQGECPGKIWRICIMWECPLLQKSFMPPKGFLGALRHHTEGRQAGRADSLSGFFVKQQQQQQQHFITMLHLPQWHASFALPARLDEDHDVHPPSGPDPSTLNPTPTPEEEHTRKKKNKKSCLSKS